MDREVVYICVICADFFDNVSVAHCLKCNHHYQLGVGTCKYCYEPENERFRVVETNLTMKDVKTCLEWSKSNEYRRGTWHVFVYDDYGISEKRG